MSNKRKRGKGDVRDAGIDKAMWKQSGGKGGAVRGAG